ncbi:hypothetical protein JZX87_28625, partial [Agrobacterium sp. Ap1]|nr:hypothetical protein [Agrobacterium sp. Ap1]
SKLTLIRPSGMSRGRLSYTTPWDTILLALASIYDGGSRGDAARLGSVTVQIVRDWVVRFNDRGMGSEQEQSEIVR